MRFGWATLLVFVCLGTALEVLHAFKVGAYLDVGNETRRMMWTLAHTHGTLLGLINIVFALSIPSLTWSEKTLLIASRSLRAATVLVPGGFFAGGVFLHGTDPGIGAFVVPIGALLLIVALVLITRAVK